jgi:hypothetical protein
MYGCHVVISSATISNSFRINAVKEMDTMLMNSFSNSHRDKIMIAPPMNQSTISSVQEHALSDAVSRVLVLTLVYTDQQPGKKGLV